LICTVGDTVNLSALVLLVDTAGYAHKIIQRIKITDIPHMAASSGITVAIRADDGNLGADTRGYIRMRKHLD